MPAVPFILPLSLLLSCLQLTLFQLLSLSGREKESLSGSHWLRVCVCACVCVLLALIRALGFHANLGKLPHTHTHAHVDGATVLGQLLHFLCPLKKKKLCSENHQAYATFALSELNFYWMPKLNCLWHNARNSHTPTHTQIATIFKECSRAICLAASLMRGEGE